MDNSPDIPEIPSDPTKDLQLKIERYYIDILCLYNNRDQMREFREFFAISLGGKKI
jgi:hypothetical protein